MLERFIYFKEEIDLLLEKASNLSTSKKSSINIEAFNIEEEEWNYLILVRNILEIFRKPTIKLQSSNYSTIYYTIPYITRLLKEIENYTLDNILEENNPFIINALLESYNKLLEYYNIKDSNINKLKDLYLVTLLNPQFKLELFTNLGYSNTTINNIKLYFIEVYNKYKIKYSNSTTNINIDSQISLASTSTKNLEDYNSDDEFYIDNNNNNNNNNLDNREEYEIYLEENRTTSNIDFIDYYKANKSKFPILYNLVKDYLAIITTSALSESTFSKVGDIITKKRNKLLPNTIKQIITLKSWNIIEDEETTLNDNIEDFKDIAISTKGKEKEIVTINKTRTSSNASFIDTSENNENSNIE